MAASHQASHQKTGVSLHPMVGIVSMSLYSSFALSLYKRVLSVLSDIKLSDQIRDSI